MVSIAVVAVKLQQIENFQGYIKLFALNDNKVRSYNYLEAINDPAKYQLYVGLLLLFTLSTSILSLLIRFYDFFKCCFDRCTKNTHKIASCKVQVSDTQLC